MLYLYAAVSLRDYRHDIGRKILQMKYEELFGEALPSVAIGPRGKPYLPNGECYFSISHTDGWTYCAISDHEVGLDIEHVRPVSMNAVKRILSDSELTEFYEDKYSHIAFMKFWTLKEAYVKYTGKGLCGVSPYRLEFTLKGTNPKMIYEKNLCFWNRLHHDIVVSLCTEKREKPIFELLTQR